VLFADHQVGRVQHNFGLKANPLNEIKNDEPKGDGQIVVINIRHHGRCFRSQACCQHLPV